MDIIKDYISKYQSSTHKPKVSNFFVEREDLITKLDYESVQDLSYKSLKQYWAQCFNTYKDAFTLDFNLVDWHGLIGKIMHKMANAEAACLILNSLKNKASNSFQTLEDPFNDVPKEIPFNMTILVLKAEFLKLKNTAKRQNNIYKQDYLHYGILDFVNKVDNNSTKVLLGNDYNLWKENLNSKLSSFNTHNTGKAKITYEYTKSVLRQCKSVDGIQMLQKKAKKELNADTIDYIYKKTALKIIKLYAKQQRNGVNRLQSNTQNEYSFIIDYLSKVICIIFDIEKDLWNYKWGETKLAASKEEENLAKNDNEKRSVGSSIDGIIHVDKLNLDLLLLEVSGPMWKEDYTHFLKDRLKIAKNLKKILKSMFRKSFVLAEARNVNVFGLHIYRNTIHLYCMSMPILNFYCFTEVMKFDIPIGPASYAKELPLYVKNLMKMFIIVKAGYDAAENYMINYDYTSDESLSCGESFLSPPYVSPQKDTTKAKRNTTEAGSSVNKKKKQRAN